MATIQVLNFPGKFAYIDRIQPGNTPTSPPVRSTGVSMTSHQEVHSEQLRRERAEIRKAIEQEEGWLTPLG